MISTRVHGIIDYAVAALFGTLCLSGRLSPRVSRTLGAASAYHTLYSAVTDYEAGVAAKVTMRQHLALDAAGAVALVGAGLAMRRAHPLERALLMAAGLAEIAVVALSDSQPVSGPGQGSGVVGRVAGSEGGSDAAYPPLDTLKPVADGVWIVDGAPIRVLGVPFPVRMTVIRLASGDLILHSPTQFTAGLGAELDRIGRVAHLVAPNSAHWTFLKAWQDACPAAATWAAPGLRDRAQVRRSGVRLDHDLGDAPPPAWAGEIALEVVPGGLGFREVAVFHRPSRTLVLTDLVVNLEAEKMPALVRPGLRLLGATAPDGMAPTHVRTIVEIERDAAARAAERVLAWQPERVVFAHGQWFERDGAARLRRSWRWLLPQA
jgi:hypothetical protein